MKIHFRENKDDNWGICGTYIPRLRRERGVYLTRQVSFVDCKRCMKMLDIMLKSGKRIRSKT